MTKTNTISLEFKTPKENEHVIRWYLDIHVHNKTKYSSTSYKLQGGFIFMTWSGVAEEDCSAIINAITELSPIYGLNITTKIEEEPEKVE